MTERHTINVLVTDDDDMVREMLADALTMAGLNVMTAANGRQCLDVLRQHAVDVIVIDIVMPEKEGIETIIDIRKHYPGKKIIAISGGGRTGNDDFLLFAQKIGAHATLRKPFEPTLLVSQIWTLAPDLTSGGALHKA